MSLRAFVAVFATSSTGCLIAAGMIVEEAQPRGAIAAVAETRSAPDDVQRVDGGDLRITVDTIQAEVDEPGVFLRFDTSLGYAEDGGVYLTDGFEAGMGWTGRRSMVAAGLGISWGGYRTTSLQSSARVHGLWKDLFALDAGLTARVIRESAADDDAHVLGNWDVGVGVHIPTGKALRPILGLRLVREDGYDYVLASLGVGTFLNLKGRPD